MEFPVENGISAAVQGRRSLESRRSNGDGRHAGRGANALKLNRQDDGLLRAFDEEDDIELGLYPVGEEEDDSAKMLHERHSLKSPRR